MDRKIITKATALMLAFIMTFANVILLGIYTRESIAASVNLEEQSKEVANANIEFDAYFEKEGAATHNKKIDVASNSENICVEIRVLDGYLTNGKVQIKDSNFKLVNDDQELKSVQGIDEETNTIILNQINKGESVILKLPIVMNSDSNFDVENIDKISSVVLEGTYTNNNGNNASISKTIKVNAKMTANATANIEAEVRRYVPFDIGDKKGVILQISVKSNIVDNVIPVKEEKIEIEIPKINNVDPERVSLSAKSTKATNGKLERAFKVDESYTHENGKVVLTIKNDEDTNGIISWAKNCQDEIVLTCIYGETAIVEETNITLKAVNNITVYDSNETIISESIENNTTLNEKLGEIVTYNISVDNEISKGYMLVSGADITTYTEILTAEIADKEFVDSVVLDKINARDFYVDDDQNTYPAEILYTNSKISEENFISMLGEDGYIDIYDKEGEKITTLNKDNLKYTYTEEVTNIKIETSKPISEGILKIENERAIKAAEYDKAQTELFSKLRTTLVGKTTKGIQELFTKELSKEAVLIAPTTQALLTINKNNLSTQVLNEDVELRITLKTTDASTVLYKNPTIQIEFPSCVKDVLVKKPSLLYEDNLEITNAVIDKNSNGNAVVRIELSGEQSTFNKDPHSNGTIIIIDANITVDALTSSKIEEIKAHITNEATNETIEENTNVNIVAPTRNNNSKSDIKY